MGGAFECVKLLNIIFELFCACFLFNTFDTVSLYHYSDVKYFFGALRRQQCHVIPVTFLSACFRMNQSRSIEITEIFKRLLGICIARINDQNKSM